MEGTRSSFVADALKLVSGNAFARVLGWVAFAFVIKLYKPEHFGACAAFVGIVTIPCSLPCLCYEFAIMLPKSEEEAANVLGLGAAIAGTMALMVMGLAMVAAEPVAGWFHRPEIAGFLRLAPVCVGLVGLNQVLTYWVTRGRGFGLLATVQAVVVISIRGTQIALAWLGMASASSLICAVIVGYAMTLLMLGVPVWYKDGAFLRQHVRPARMWAELKRFRRFPLLQAPGFLLNAIAASLPPLLLNRLFSAEVAGHFDIADKLIRIPSNILGKAVGRVHFQRAAELHAQGESLVTLVTEVFRRVAAFSVVPMCVFALVAPEMCAAIFGDDYYESGRYVTILCPMFLALFLYSSFWELFVVFERQGALLVVQVAILATRCAALALGGRLGSAVETVAVFSGAGTLVFAGAVLWAFKPTGVSVGRCLGVLMHYLCYVAAAALVLLPLRLYGDAPRWVMLAASAAVLAIYLAVIVVRDHVLMRFLR